MLVPPEPLISFIAAVGHADGGLSKHELHLLHHLTETFLEAPLSDANWAELLRLDFDVALERMRGALVSARGLSLEQRLLLLAIGYDISAVDGVDPSEMAVVREAAELLDISPADQEALYRAIDPGGAVSPVQGASSLIRAVHMGPDPASDFVLLTPAQVTFLCIGSLRFVRVQDVRKAAFLDGQPIPIKGLTRLRDRSNLTFPPHRLTARDVSALLDARDVSWTSVVPDHVDVDVPEGLSLWRRGTMTGLEAHRPGFTLSGRPVPVGALVTLLPGDRLADAATDFGPVLAAEDITTPATPIRSETPDGELRPDRFELSEVTVRIGRTTILDRISFSFARREKVAIIGPSGSGKTTLLEVLSGHRVLRPGGGTATAFFGERRLSLPDLRTRIALVPQDDINNPFLTVREHVEFAAALRTQSVPSERRAVVEEAIARVDLSDKAELRVGTPENRILSGGQRRRVGVAQEMVASPDMILLDEPLSGLSSQDARNLSAQFNGLAAEGAAVVVVVHQPSREVLSRFDKVVVLDRGGQLIFWGTPSEGTRYFRQVAGLRSSGELEDHPDVILAVVEQCNRDGRRRFSPDYWRTLFQVHGAERAEASGHYAAVEDDAAKVRIDPTALVRPVSTGRVFRTLLHRDFLARLRNHQALSMSLLAPPILGFLVALVTFYFEDHLYTYSENSAFIHFLRLTPIMAFFFGMSGSGTEFVLDRRRIQHERRMGISVAHVLASKFLMLLCFVVVEAMLLIGPGLALMGYPGSLTPLMGLTVLVGLTGAGSGLLVSALAPNLKVAFVFVPVLLIPQIVFGGLIPYAQMSPLVRARGGASEHEAPLIAQPLPSRWGSEGLVVAAVRPCLQARCTVEKDVRALRDLQRQCGQVEDGESPSLSGLMRWCGRAEEVCGRAYRNGGPGLSLREGCRALAEGTLSQPDCVKDRSRALAAISFCRSVHERAQRSFCNAAIESEVKSANRRARVLDATRPSRGSSPCAVLTSPGDLNVFQASFRRHLGLTYAAEIWSAMILLAQITLLLLLTWLALAKRKSSSI
ncbi:MAG: ATP-binding cassette domain-containing protein [Myxococcota bacterium]